MGSKSYDYDLGRDIYFGYVGIFWYIDDRDIIEYTISDLDKEMLKKRDDDNSNYVSSEITHTPAVWDEFRIKHGLDKNRIYYPRGRVDYNVKHNLFVIRMDPCLQNDTFLDRLKEIFQLQDKKISVVPVEESKAHYKCHLCDPALKEREKSIEEYLTQFNPETCETIYDDRFSPREDDPTRCSLAYSSACYGPIDYNNNKFHTCKCRDPILMKERKKDDE